jgi:threonine/homoserine/homoserine lactone efflux protein
MSFFSEIIGFCASLLLLFALPGPSNICVMSAGMQFGLKANYATAPMVASGYFVILGILHFGAAQWLKDQPVLSGTFHLASATYLCVSAFRIWQSSQLLPSVAKDVSGLQQVARDTLMNTLLNPKALAVTFSVLPTCLHGPAEMSSETLFVLALTAAIGAVVCCGYTSLGSVLDSLVRDAMKRTLMRRVNAIFIVALVAIGLGK